MRSLSTLWRIACSVFNWKLGIVSALFNGPAVVYANWEHALAESLRAGLVQALLSAGSTGITARVAQHLSDGIRNPVLAYFLGSTIPGTMTFGFSAFTHWLNGTPELLASSLWPTFLSCSTSLCVNFAARNLAHRRGFGWVKRFILINKPIDSP